MFIIGISLIILMVVGILAFLTFIIPVFIAVRKDKKGNPPRKISYVLVGLLVFHWVFYLVSGYALLPTNIADAVFIPVWLALCLAGAITAIYEFKNNKAFAIPVAGLTIISLLLCIFSYGISKM
ncbi:MULTISPECIES: hypothetical protein [unclassified Lysinibacillus]|uniref:hypothetical protein n=1 Tax=unclassified Lysinibacillus TaxID=2636778 RepID=UPI0035D60614